MHHGEVQRQGHPGRARGAGPIVTTGPALTHEGGAGHHRDLKGELFMLAVSNFSGEDTFYEKAADRDARYARLVRATAVTDPVWTAGLLRWLRTEGNIRSASIAGAAEFAHARLGLPRVSFVELATGQPPKHPHARSIDRTLVDVVCQRADEPAEMLAYWLSHFGRSIPKPVKRGIADAATRLYTEYALLKYDTGSHGLRFGDVLELTHPKPGTLGQGALFQHAIDRRRGHDTSTDLIVGHLPMTLSQNALRAGVANGKTHLLLNPDHLRSAGMTWEDALSLAGSSIDKAKLWEALIPTMGYMALLRNLRNFDEAGISQAAADRVVARLVDPEQVARSRQFPFRFLAAQENVPSQRWGAALDIALGHSLNNIPELPGRNLVLIDTSSSMTTRQGRSTMTPAKAAAVFGVALAIRCKADLFGFADGVFRHEVPKGASLLKEVERFNARNGCVGHGTYIAESLKRTWDGHARVFVITDGQTMGGGVTHSVPDHVALYGFNLGGYQVAPLDMNVPNRYELGGLTDATFKQVPLIEAGRDATWPWM